MAENHAATTDPPVRCPVCGSIPVRRSTAGERARYECREPTCRLQFLYPQPTPAELAELYGREYYPSDATDPAHTYENSPEEVSRALVRTLQASAGGLIGRRLLDFGAGIGGFALVAKEAGAEVWCIEQSAEARRRMTVLGLTCFEDLGALLAARPDARFEVISSIEVVEHLADPVADLRALRQVLTPGGVLFLATPNFTSLRARLQGAAWSQYANPTHLTYLTPVSVRRILHDAGFTSVTRLPTRVNYPSHGRLRRLLQHVLQRVGLDGDLIVVASG
jgi:SAM-dependent methyltransferase